MQISDAFKRFGISDRDDSALVVVVHGKDNELQAVSDIMAMVDGQQLPVDEVSSLSDLEKIRKVGYLVVDQRSEGGGTRRLDHEPGSVEGGDCCLDIIIVH
ncbi:hypothetical protein GOODEAATRI_027461 [Goodea atripinnis]|uniref:Uncharacterized protein n=1 Tax=Goodea atripinnis TaxID=208336 RepID=A0ABV0ML98_9TELE